MEGGPRPGYRRSGSLASLVLGHCETISWRPCTTKFSRSSKDPTRAWEGLNVWPGPLYMYCKIVVVSRSRLAKKRAITTNIDENQQNICSYSWIADQLHTHTKNCQQTRRATTIPRPPLEKSRQGEFRSASHIFVQTIVCLFSK